MQITNILEHYLHLSMYGHLKPNGIYDQLATLGHRQNIYNVIKRLK